MRSSKFTNGNQTNKKVKKTKNTRTYLLLKFILNYQFVNFLFLNQVSGPSQKTYISQPQPSPLTKISKPHTVMLLPLHPAKTSWKLVFGNRLANTLSCLLQATKALLGRPALSPEPSRPPLCSRTQRGRKSRSVFASHVGTQALYTLQWHCRYFVSLTNRGEACKGCKKKFW